MTGIGLSYVIRVATKIFSRHPKVPDFGTVNENVCRFSDEKFFGSTLKLAKKLTLTKKIEDRGSPRAVHRKTAATLSSALFS
jgi:N12 class adenine-specific DNA methylase